MSIENPMVSGEWPYNQEYAPEPDYVCPRCSMPMESTDTVFEWQDDWICADCFTDAVLSLSQADRADMAGESIPYTEQQLELIEHNALGMADILFVETKYVEDIT